MGQIGKQEKETLCWGCENYSRCSWADGIPVKGWKATPTEYIDKWGGVVRVVHSFLVEDCPQFVADKKRLTTAAEMGAILGKSASGFRLLLKRKGFKFVAADLKEKGYKFSVQKEGRKRAFYLEKI